MANKPVNNRIRKLEITTANKADMIITFEDGSTGNYKVSNV